MRVLMVQITGDQLARILRGVARVEDCEPAPKFARWLVKNFGIVPPLSEAGNEGAAQRQRGLRQTGCLYTGSALKTEIFGGAGGLLGRHCLSQYEIQCHREKGGAGIHGHPHPDGKVAQVYISNHERCYSSRVRRGLVLWLLWVSYALPQTGLQMAVTLTREGRYAEARRALNGVQEPEGIRQKIAFHRLRAAIASGLKEAPAAANEMRAALELAPQDTQLLAATAVAELQAGQFPQAVNAYQEAIRLAPENESYRIALAIALIEHQAFESAIGMLKASPKSAKLLVLLGLAQYGHGDNAEAIDTLEQAFALEPALDSPKRCLAGIVLESAKLPSQKTVDVLCAWDKTVCAALQLRRAREDGDAALEARSVATLEKEDSAVAHCALGRAYEWRNQLKQAAQQMESCIRFAPTPQRHYMLALIYRKLGDTARAHRELNLREKMLQRISEQATLTLNALASFQAQH